MLQDKGVRAILSVMNEVAKRRSGVVHELRRIHVVKGLELGKTHMQLAEELGVPLWRINKDVLLITQRYRQEQANNIYDMRALVRRRYERLMGAIDQQCMEGNIYAINATQKLLKEYAILLGLNAPIKKELSGPDGGPIRTMRFNIDVTAMSQEKLLALTDLAAEALTNTVEVPDESLSINDVIDVEVVDDLDDSEEWEEEDDGA